MNLHPHGCWSDSFSMSHHWNSTVFDFKHRTSLQVVLKNDSIGGTQGLGFLFVYFLFICLFVFVPSGLFIFILNLLFIYRNVSYHRVWGHRLHLE